MEMVKKYKERPFAMLAVSSDSKGRSGLAKIVQGMKLNYRSAVDGPKFAGISSDYQIQTHPTTFVLDAKGIIRYSWVGYVEPGVMTKAVETLLRHTSSNSYKKHVAAR